MEYTKSLVEVSEVINHLKEEDLSKIPDDVILMINENKDKNYEWKYDNTKSLKEQNLSRTSIVILSYINMEYLLNEQQKQFMEKLHSYNEAKLKEKSNENNDYSDLFKKDKNGPVVEQQALIKVEKEKWYNKLLKRIKKLFKRHN